MFLVMDVKTCIISRLGTDILLYLGIAARRDLGQTLRSFY